MGSNEDETPPQWPPIALMEANSHPFTAFRFGRVYEFSAFSQRFGHRQQISAGYTKSRRMFHWSQLFHDLNSGDDVSQKQSETLMSKLNVLHEMNIQVHYDPLDLNEMFYKPWDIH